MRDSIFQSPVWKLIALIFIAVLSISFMRFLFIVQDSLIVVHDLMIERGVSVAWEINEIIWWGQISLFMLIFIGVVSLFDLAIVKNLKRLKEVDMLRRELVANVAHDLGGPVTSIQGYVETVLMKEGKLTPDERNTLLKTILYEVKALGRLVAELFDLSKLDTKSVEPKVLPFSINTLSSDVASRFLPQAQNSGIMIEVLDVPNLPLVMGDIDLIERVISNIIENALVHTKSGGKITLSFESRFDEVLISISDTGSGIPKEDLPFVFDRFYRVGKDRSRASGGAGLGLAIVKKILEAHKSTIVIESELGVGTKLCFSLKQR